MDKFLDFIERHKFAIIGTVLFHVVFFMSTNFVTVQRPFHVEEEITEVEIETDAIELDEELLEMLNRQNEMNHSEQLYNLAADENDTRERSYENFSTQELDQQVENEARDLERQYFEEWASTHPDSEGANNDSGTPEDNERENTSRNNDRGPGNVDNEGGNAFAGQVMVSFSLKDRKAHSLEIPGYTCNGSGTVVIDIKVDKAGNVKNTEFNSSLSKGATECMVEKAKRYAKRARFNYSESASGMASGTITYKFQGQ